MIGLRLPKQSAIAFLTDEGEAVKAMGIAVKILEDDQNTNAGNENILTVDGVVECNTKIIESNSDSLNKQSANNSLDYVSVNNRLLSSYTNLLGFFGM